MACADAGQAAAHFSFTGATRACFKSAQSRRGICGLFGVLKRLEMSLEGLAIFVLGFDFGL
jgi:hypothetical protein